MWLAKPTDVVCTWSPLKHSRPALAQVYEMCCHAGSGVQQSGCLCVQCLVLRVPAFSRQSVQESFIAWELCCSCDPSKMLMFSNYWIECSCYHRTVQNCLHYCSCTLTPKASSGGVTQQLQLPGGAALLTCIPLGCCFLSAGFDVCPTLLLIQPTIKQTFTFLC